MIHSPSPATFRQFDDLLLLGKGGMVVYMGPRDRAVSYFASVGFPCPPDESPSDFFMDIVTGKVKNIYDPGFKLTHLFDCKYMLCLTRKDWEKTIAGQPVFASSHSHPADNSFDAHQIPRKSGPIVLMPQEPQKSKKMSFLKSLMISSMAAAQNAAVWCADVVSDYCSFLIRTFRVMFCIPDPVRDTCRIYMQLWLLMKRAFQQSFRDAQSIIFDLLLHFGCGTFISVATQNFSYLGNFPVEVCVSQARDLQWFCYTPLDKIKEAGMFISLGVLFAGISAGTTTFGREKVVFWRDSASGMSAIPYYFAKFVVDIPRVILAGIVYSVALLLFYPLQGRFVSVLLIVELLYFSAFAMGYFLSILVPPSKTALLGTGFALLWALVLSGVIPTLEDVYSEPVLTAVSFLWDLSPPRWAIEAFW